MNAIIELFKNMELPKLLAFFGSVLAVMIFFAFILLKYISPEMVPLYGNLEIEDSNKIITELEQRGLKYELRANGTQILVESDKALRLRMQLAQEGIPGKGSIVGYEIFDNSDSMTTSNFVQNIHLIRALEGELGRTIATFNKIKKARVHLVIPRKELFSKDLQKPSASIVLEMEGSETLTVEEANAISHLVATAIPSLNPDRVTIVDTRGKPLKIGDEELSADGTSFNSKNHAYRIEYENRLKKTIENLLEKTVGVGGVEAQVSVEMNFDRTITNSEVFDPDGQVVRSTQTIQENDNSKEKGQNGDVSVNNNVPNGSIESGIDIVDNESQKTDETVNYEISKTVKNFISETGVVKKMSIAVLIDGRYSKDSSGVIKYTPRNNDEVEQIKKLVKSAVGFNESRKDSLEVVNMQFKNISEDLPPEPTVIDTIKTQLQTRLYDIIKITIISILATVVLLLFIKPLINRIFETATATIQAQVDAEVAIARAEVQHANIKAQAEKEVRSVLIDEGLEEAITIKKNKAFKSINDMVEQCPQETVMIIRNWLNS